MVGEGGGKKSVVLDEQSRTELTPIQFACQRNAKTYWQESMQRPGLQSYSLACETVVVHDHFIFSILLCRQMLLLTIFLSFSFPFF